MHRQRTGKFFSSYDLQKYTAGATKAGLSINSASVQMIGAVLASRHGAIFVGNVNGAGLAKTSMVKSVLDACWSAFRTMLRYKSIATGVLFE